MRRADPHRALIWALAVRYPGLLVLTSRTENWASATFVGARHILICSKGVQLGGIEDEEFALPGHFIADIAARADGDCLVVEALTIEAA
jgi:hypothetical protein